MTLSKSCVPFTFQLDFPETFCYDKHPNTQRVRDTNTYSTSLFHNYITENTWNSTIREKNTNHKIWRVYTVKCKKVFKKSSHIFIQKKKAKHFIACRVVNQTLDSAIHWISITIQWICIGVTKSTIQWIEIYSVDSFIHLLNIWGLVM